MSAGNLKYTLVVRNPETSTATALLAGEPVPAWAKDLVHADDIEGGSGGGSSDEPKPYAKWLKADLEAEVAKRNEDRETPIEVGGTGKVADLAEALEADDAANAGDND